MSGPLKSTGLINPADTVGVITHYPVIDLNLPELVVRPEMGAERVKGAAFLS